VTAPIDVASTRFSRASIIRNARNAPAALRGAGAAAGGSSIGFGEVDSGRGDGGIERGDEINGTS
jgi:hypothetical protein